MISTVWAQDAVAPAANAGGALMSALPFVLVFAVFYFFVMRPQMLAAKKHAALLDALKKGDVVVTDGGLIGEISSLKEGMVQVRIAEGVVVTVAREAVRATLVGEVAKDWDKAGSATKAIAEPKSVKKR